MYRGIVKYSNKHFSLYKQLSTITDSRQRPQISTADVCKSISSMMFSNLGSLNKLSDAISFGAMDATVDRVPSITTIARTADSINLDDISQILKDNYLKARRAKMIEDFAGKAIGIVDGHENISSYIPKCSHCSTRDVSKVEGVERLQYYHRFVAFILAGEKFTTILDIEPILPGEGELTSSYRLIERVCLNYPKAFKIMIGDGLFLAGPVFTLLSSHSKYAIAVLKDKNRQIYEEVVALSNITEPVTYKQNKTCYRVWEHKISGLWDGYKKEVIAIKSEETTTKRRHSRKIGSDSKWEYIEKKAEWMWVTNLPCIGDLKNTVCICHSRWQIENQCFNETVNTWKADHVYRHSENAILVFLLLLFIVVNIVNIFFNRNIKDRRISTKVILIDLIKSEFLSIKRPLPPRPIPI